MLAQFENRCSGSLQRSALISMDQAGKIRPTVPTLRKGGSANAQGDFCGRMILFQRRNSHGGTTSAWCRPPEPPRASEPLPVRQRGGDGGFRRPDP